MNKREWQAIHTEIMELVRAAAKKHGLNVEKVSGRHSEYVMTVGFALVSAGPESLAARVMEATADWRYLCQMCGLKEEWLSQTFKDGGDEYKIVGVNLKARKNMIRLERVRDNKPFTCTPLWAKTKMEKPDGQ